MNSFEQKIKEYCDELARQDKAFARAYAKKNKSIEECCKYIIEQASKQAFSAPKGRMAAIADDDVYAMAVHYFHEDSVGATKDIEAKVVAPTTTKKASKRAKKSTAPNVESTFAMEIPLFEI